MSRKTRNTGMKSSVYVIGVMVTIILFGVLLSSASAQEDEASGECNTVPPLESSKPLETIPPIKECTVFLSEEEETGKLPDSEETQETSEPMQLLATAYCHCEKCCGKTPEDPAYGITYSGLNLLNEVEPHVIAADMDLFPIGSVLHIEVVQDDGEVVDIGEWTVEDIGGAIQGNRIDVYMKTHQEAIEWGMKRVNVYVLEEP